MRTSIDLQGYLTNWRVDLEKAAERKRVQGMEAHQEAESIEADIADLDRAIAALEPAPIPEPEQTGEGVEIPAGFTKWEGGECPVDEACELIFGTHGKDENPFYTDNPLYYIRCWQHAPSTNPIIAYRIIEPARNDADEPDDASEFAEPVEAVEFKRLCEGCLVEEGFVHEADCPVLADERAAEMRDEAQRAAAIELTADVEPMLEPQEPYPEAEPLPVSEWIDQQTCEPIDPTLRAFQDDHIVEPEQTEGYAHVTDAWVETAPNTLAEYTPATNPEADALAKGHDWYDPKAVHERNKFNPFGIFGHKRETEDA